MQFTLISGANSAAIDTANPSTAAFADAIIEWLVNPLCAATVENNTIEPLFFFKLSWKPYINTTAEYKFNFIHLLKSFSDDIFNGFKSIDPTQ